MTIETAGQIILDRLDSAGYDAYFVGGMVRDVLLRRDVYDADITTSASPEEVLSLFEKAIPTGIKHGTVTVVVERINIEVTTFRLDGEYLDNRRPKEVIFTNSLVSDLSRRDFTINAMAKGLSGCLVDPFGGKADLEAGLIRAVGKAIVRFEEDGLRILRGIRFVSKLGFDVERDTLDAMEKCRHLLAQLSLERIRKELEGIMAGDYRVKALKIMRDGLLFDSLPFLENFSNLTDEEIMLIDSFELLILLAHKQTDKFLLNFPVTRSEKKLVEGVDKALGFKEIETDRHKLVQYYFGIKTLELLTKYEFLYKKGERKVANFTPIIEKRTDLVLCPREVIATTGKKAGAWVNHLFTKMERKVILGELENCPEDLLKFVKESVIFDVEEN